MTSAYYLCRRRSKALPKAVQLVLEMNTRFNKIRFLRLKIGFYVLYVVSTSRNDGEAPQPQKCGTQLE